MPKKKNPQKEDLEKDVCAKENPKRGIPRELRVNHKRKGITRKRIMEKAIPVNRNHENIDS